MATPLPWSSMLLFGGIYMSVKHPCALAFVLLAVAVFSILLIVVGVQCTKRNLAARNRWATRKVSQRKGDGHQVFSLYHG